MLKWVKSLFGLNKIHEAKQLRTETCKNIEEVKRLLQIDGEDEWFLNQCRSKKGEKECYPDDK